MRRDDRQPFDIEAHEAADITQQFWGTSRGWDRLDRPAADDEGWGDRTHWFDPGDHVGLAGIRTGGHSSSDAPDVTGRVDRTRSHGIPRPEPPARTTGSDARPRRRWASWRPAGSTTTTGPSSTTSARSPPGRAPGSSVSATVTGSTSRRRRPGSTTTTSSTSSTEFDEDDCRLVPVTENQTLSSRLGLGAVDPLLARLGAIVLIGVLLIPLALSVAGRRFRRGGR